VDNNGNSGQPELTLTSRAPSDGRPLSTFESSLPNLHDAILQRVSVDWAEAVATIELERNPGVAVVLTAPGLCEFSLTHRQEWGPSVSVNGVDLQTDEDGKISMTIEMRSGDNIRLVAARLEVL